jgi:glucose dehydrogenase
LSLYLKLPLIMLPFRWITTLAGLGGDILGRNRTRLRASVCLLTAMSFWSSIAVVGQVNVMTFHYDSARTGQNTAETVLTPANVNSSQFGKLFSVPVDGYVYAQPLYMANVQNIAGGTHNVIYAATEHDSLYAIDADNGAVLWQLSFINPAAGVTSVSSSDTA